MKQIMDTSICTGCSACYNICPVSAIEMMADEGGFLYPHKTDRCINCGKCERVCPQRNTNIKKEEFNQKAFAALSKDKRIWRNSSSGGASMEILKAYDSGNTVFFWSCLGWVEGQTSLC